MTLITQMTYKVNYICKRFLNGSSGTVPIKGNNYIRNIQWYVSNGLLTVKLNGKLLKYSYPVVVAKRLLACKLVSTYYV